jgi:hypothetical protein
MNAMNDITDSADCDGDRDDDLHALLRKVDASVERALAADIDIEGRLAQLKAIGRPHITDNELAATLAVWSAELLADANRGTTSKIQAVDDPPFFRAAVGRERAGMEPWPEMQVTLAETQPQGVSVTVALPSLASARTRVTATVMVGSWNSRCELHRVSPAVDGTDDEAYDEVDGSVAEISGTVLLPQTVRLQSLSGVGITLRVETT